MSIGGVAWESIINAVYFLGPARDWPGPKRRRPSRRRSDWSAIGNEGYESGK